MFLFLGLQFILCSQAFYSYGIPQDEAARTGQGSADIAQSGTRNASATFTCVLPAYSVTVVVLEPVS